MRGGPRGENLQNFLWSRKKNLVIDPAAIFFVFQVNISCKTTSIILYFKYASFSVVTRKKRQNTNHHPDGNFFVDRFRLGILRDAWAAFWRSFANGGTELEFAQVVVQSLLFWWPWFFCGCESAECHFFLETCNRVESQLASLVFFPYLSSSERVKKFKLKKPLLQASNPRNKHRIA